MRERFLQYRHNQILGLCSVVTYLVLSFCPAVLSAQDLNTTLLLEKEWLAAAEYELPYLIGNARDRKTGQHLYTEYHYSRGAAGSHSVVYRDDQSKIIAFKKLRYGELATRPAVFQYNYLVGEVVSVKRLNDNQLSITYRETVNEGERTQALSVDDSIVVDAGFDGLVRNNWSMSVEDDIDFQFLVPSRLSSYSFRLASVSCAENREARCFEAAPSSWLLRRFVAPIRVDYDAESQRLMKFSGLGNIANASGDYMSVDIDYKYPSYNFD
ncbi:hypothetical protein [Aurantivibrio plasticivorans]